MIQETSLFLKFLLLLKLNVENRCAYKFVLHREHNGNKANNEQIVGYGSENSCKPGRYKSVTDKIFSGLDT